MNANSHARLEEGKMSKEVKNICVYCGSSSRSRPLFQETARTLGHMLAENDWDLVYGGAKVGLMGIVADSALEKGAKVTGVMPVDLIKWEVEHTDLTELVKVESMHERKMEMVERSDAFVILPGGLGTLDETFEILTWKQLNLHDKPIIIANIQGYWDGFLNLIDHMVEENFALETSRELFSVVHDIKDVPDAIMNAPRSKSEPATKWM